MKNLKIWQKLLLLAAVFMLPFLIVTATLLSTVKEQVDFAQGELDGVDYAVPLLKLGRRPARAPRASPIASRAGSRCRPNWRPAASNLRSDLARSTRCTRARRRGLRRPALAGSARAACEDLLAKNPAAAGKLRLATPS
jgi:hypothetical protein